MWGIVRDVGHAPKKDRKNRGRKKPAAGKPEPRWRYLERISAILERTFDNGAAIRRNERIPELMNPDSVRECDITVRTGPPARRTLSIVEVQKRGRKVEIGAFDGWVAKMRAVGAQHLIGVSEKGFPRSVVERAAQLGPTVRLATIRELKRNEWPQVGLNGVTITQTNIDAIEDLAFVVEDTSDRIGETGTSDFHAKVLRDDEGNEISLNQIACAALDRTTAPNGSSSIQYRTGKRFTLLDDASAERLDVRMTIRVTRTELAVGVDFLEYKQLNDEDARSWVMTGRTRPQDGLEEKAVHVVFRPDEDGRLLPRLIQVDGLTEDDRAVVSVSDPGLKLTPVGSV